MKFNFIGEDLDPNGIDVPVKYLVAYSILVFIGVYSLLGIMFPR